MVKLKKLLGESIMQGGVSVLATKLSPTYVNPFSKALSNKTITTQAESNLILLESDSDFNESLSLSIP